MSSSKFDQMFKFISQYKYEISENVPDNLKCEKCKNILINAYCVPCGCSYCCECLSEMLKNGVENCCGQTEVCKNELISINQVDLRRNREISNVVMKCPEEMCLHECAIINMEEHVHVCLKKSVKCPFANVGCDGKEIAKEMLNDHCQSANFNHCEILIEMIDNMRNGIDILKANDKKNQLKIENLEDNLKSKDEIIDKINKKLIHLIKIEKDENKRECDKINLENKIMEISGKIQKENQDLINLIIDQKKVINQETKKSEMMETKINKLNKIIDYFDYAMIEWRIDKLDEKRKKDEYIWSEYFTGMIKQYKLALLFWVNGNIGDVKGKGGQIYLYIYASANDQLLSWPFTADVTIKMMSKTNRNIKQIMTKYCKIEKPINNSYNFSAPFNYLYCDLTEDQEKMDNCFIVECFVDFK